MSEAADAVNDDGAVEETTGATDDTAGHSAHNAEDSEPRPTLLDQIGGPMGMVDSGLPVVVFVVVNAIAGLVPGIVAALAGGVVIAAVRLIRHQPATQAIGGLLAVGVAGYIAYRMGSARGFFLLGIWKDLVYGVVVLASVVVRWPLIGVLWEALNGRGTDWRRDVRLRHRYDAATLVWTVVFALRYGVQQWLYGADQVGWLAGARLAMGYPLFIVAVVATIVIVGSASGITVGGLWRHLRHRGADDQAPPPAAGRRDGR